MHAFTNYGCWDTVCQNWFKFLQRTGIVYNLGGSTNQIVLICLDVQNVVIAVKHFCKKIPNINILKETVHLQYKLLTVPALM